MEDAGVGRRVWRVRWWARALAVVVPPGMPFVVTPTVADWRAGTVDGWEMVWFGLIYLVVCWLLLAAFRSRVEVEGGQVRVVNPWGTRTFPTSAVSAVRPGGFGVEFRLHGGGRVVAFAVQCTAVHVGVGPRWVGVATAVTGEPPAGQAGWYDSRAEGWNPPYGDAVVRSVRWAALVLFAVAAAVAALAVVALLAEPEEPGIVFPMGAVLFPVLLYSAVAEWAGKTGRSRHLWLRDFNTACVGFFGWQAGLLAATLHGNTSDVWRGAESFLFAAVLVVVVVLAYRSLTHSRWELIDAGHHEPRVVDQGERA